MMNVGLGQWGYSLECGGRNACDMSSPRKVSAENQELVRSCTSPAVNWSSLLNPVSCAHIVAPSKYSTIRLGLNSIALLIAATSPHWMKIAPVWCVIAGPCSCQLVCFLALHRAADVAFRLYACVSACVDHRQSRFWTLCLQCC